MAEYYKKKKKYKYVRKHVEYDNNELSIKIANPNKESFNKWLKIIQSIPEAEFNSSSRYWNVTATKKNMRILNEASFHFDDKSKDLWSRMNRKKFKIKPHDLSDYKIDETGLDKLRPYQIDGVKFIDRNEGSGIIGDDMGIGKTIQAIGCFVLSQQFPVLIICPSYLKLNWLREILKWTKISEKRIEILQGNSVYSFERKKIVIINYDILDSWIRFLIEYKFKIIIGDEIQYCGNPGSKRSVAFTKITRSIERKIFLSGTPIMNFPKEFFTILNLLDVENFPNYYKFLYRYCDPTHNGFDWQYKGATNIAELRSLVHPLMIRRLKKEVLPELPEKQRITILLEIESVEYNERDNALIGWSKTLRAKEKSTAEKNFSFLKQLAYRAKKESVIKWIKDYILSNDKIVVFAYHIEALDDLQKVFKDISVRVDGSVSMIDRQKAEDEFQTNSKIKIFLGQIQACSTGINLTAASATVTIEFVWNSKRHEQAEDRIHRIGNEAEAIFAYYLAAAGTIDEYLIKLIQKKNKNITNVLDGKEEKFFDLDILDEIVEIYKRRET